MLEMYEMHEQPRDHLYALELDFDWEAQLSAIRQALALLRQQSSARRNELKSLEREARKASSAAYLQIEMEYGELFEGSIYGDAAYSMSALGMLAPFVETVFHQGFLAIGRRMSAPSYKHDRWETGHVVQWDCHFVLSSGKVSRNLIGGIFQISEAVGLSSKLPDDLRMSLEALFLYRNKMFHHGFEWPKKERDAFEARTKSWPSNWFSKATSGGQPWLFYLTDDFIAQLVEMLEHILDGMGMFVEENRDKLFPPVEVPAFIAERIKKDRK